jgi:hypothetical protein
MKLTVSKSYVDAEGRVMAVTMPMPVEPVKYPGGDFTFEAEYKATLQKVKDTSVVYEDQGHIKAILYSVFFKQFPECKDRTRFDYEMFEKWANGYPKPDTFYDIDTVEVEIDYYVEDKDNESGWMIISKDLYEAINNNHDNAKVVLKGKTSTKAVARILPEVEYRDTPWGGEIPEANTAFLQFQKFFLLKETPTIATNTMVPIVEKPEQSEWIPVTSDIPSSKLFNHKEVDIKLCDGSIIVKTIPQLDGDFWSEVLQVFITLDKVTDWRQPLPSPPKP